ncbi:MAG: heme biosynthesis protein HemY [Bauldia sp.]|nr:heme biosynthesis protein HemY [Bauldia sp.]
MIRVLVFVAILFALAVGFVWLADNPGSLTLRFADLEIEMTVMVAAVLAIVFILVVWALLGLIRALRRSARRCRRAAERRRERGQFAQSRALVAVGAGDGTLAAHYAAEARSYLRDDPLTLLVTAQASQLAGDGMGAKAAFESMLVNPETRLLGFRGLFIEARRRHDVVAARSFAAEALREKPSLGWAGNALLEYQAREGEWSGALATLDAMAGAGGIETGRAHRLRAVLLTARALEIEDGEPEAARDLAFEAHRLAPELVPASVAAARLAVRLGDPRRAAKAIEATWRIEPHPELAAAYMDVRPGESGRDRLKRMRTLTKLRANHLEGQLAIARAAIDAQDWPAAREELKGVMASRPTERAYLLMAEVEEGEHGDIGRARDWLGRAVRAPADPAWMADGVVFDHWAAVSPVTGRLDAFEWKAPEHRLPGREPPVVDDAPAATAIEADSEPAAPAEGGANLPVPLPPRPGPVVADDLGLIHQPDDPGPESEPEPPPVEPPKPPRRFRLF